MKFPRITLIFFILLLATISGITHAQEVKMYTVAYFSRTDSPAFKARMTELGYIEGVNLTYLTINKEGFETMTPEDQTAETLRQQQAIIATQPDVIFTNNDNEAVKLRQIAGNIPIVFNLSDDPVATGAVQDLINPGGFTTGTVTNRHHERRLQILTEILPSTDKILYLYSSLTTDSELVLHQVQAVGEALNVEVIPAPIVDLESSLEVLKNVPEGVDWLFMTPYVPRDLAFTEALNAVSLEREIGIAGIVGSKNQTYLMGYGPDVEYSYAKSVDIIDLILRGANPAALPVQTAENFLMINLERAEAIHMDISDSILRQANVITRPGDFALTATPAS